MKKAIQYNWFVGMTTKEGDAIAKDAAKVTIAKMLAEYEIHAFSVSEQIGYWKQVQEVSLVVSFINMDKAITGLTAKEIAERFRDTFNQECVLVSTVETWYQFI